MTLAIPNHAPTHSLAFLSVYDLVFHPDYASTLWSWQSDYAITSDVILLVAATLVLLHLQELPSVLTD